MGNAKVRKKNGTYPEKTFAPKLMIATKEDITTSYIKNMNKLGMVMLIVCIPDEQAHPGESQNISIYGNIPDTKTQVAVMREVADKIENSSEGQEKQKLSGVQ